MASFFSVKILSPVVFPCHKCFESSPGLRGLDELRSLVLPGVSSCRDTTDSGNVVETIRDEHKRTGGTVPQVRETGPIRHSYDHQCFEKSNSTLKEVRLLKTTTYK